MKITIITSYSFGYIEKLVAKLETYSDVTVQYVNFDLFKFRYSSILQRGTNFLTKILGGRSLKKEYKSKKLMESLCELEKQDVLLVVRPDKLSFEALQFMKGKTARYITFLFDALNKIPQSPAKLALFDEIFSYEKDDVARHGFSFSTNFIPNQRVDAQETNGVFNISSYDERFKTLERIAQQLKKLDYPYDIIVKKERPIHSPFVKIITGYMNQEAVAEKVKTAKIMLDVQKDDQLGLSFRVFEALGQHKKLITTNADIVNYDFYNPNNILVLDPKSINIDLNFLESPYQIPDKKIIEKYTRAGWIEKVFRLKKEQGEA